MRQFHLLRKEDVSGISGTDVVAEGVEFSTGKCVLGWVTKFKSLAIYDSLKELVNVHGHDGKTSRLP